MKRIISLILLALIIPQVALAAWWNPFSWKIFTRIFTPRTEVAPVATSTDSNAEIERLRAEVEELKKQEADDTAREKINAPVIKSSKPVTPANLPQTQPVTTSMDKNVSYSDIVKNYKDFQSVITNERAGLVKNSSLYTEREYYKYLDGLITRINADLGYLFTIESWNPRPANIEGIYSSKFNALKAEYSTKAANYPADRESDRIAQEQAEKEAAEEAIKQAVLEKEQYAKDIKIRIAEMDQLRTQIDTLAASSLVPILNAVKKIDGQNLFYTFKFICGVGGSECTFYYPYESNKYLNGNAFTSNVEVGLQAIVSNYRAFLNVELAKYQ